MNGSVYIFGKLTSGYTQYPDDNKKTIFKKVADSIYSKAMIAIRRDGNLVYYIYSRKISDSQGEPQYIGLSLELNDVYCDDLSALFSLFDDSITKVVLTGKIVEFDDSGEIVAKTSSLYHEQAEVARISKDLLYAVESLPSMTFKKLPPINYSIGINEETNLTNNSFANEVANALKNYNVINVYKADNADAQAIDAYSAKLKKLSSQLSSLTTEKDDLNNELIKVKRQKKRTTVVTVLLSLIVLIIVIFIYVRSDLSQQIISLRRENDSKEDKINNQQAIISEYAIKNKDLQDKNNKYTTKNKNLLEEINRKTNELTEAQERIKTLNTSNKYLEGQVSSLLSQKSSLESQISNLKNQLGKQSQISGTSSSSSNSPYNPSSNNRASSSIRIVYSKKFSMKVGEMVRAQITEGKITKWEIEKYQKVAFHTQGDVLIALKPGKYSIWGYVNDRPKLFTITIR